MWDGMWTRCPRARHEGLEPLGGGECALRWSEASNGVDIEVVRPRVLGMLREQRLERRHRFERARVGVPFVIPLFTG